MNLHTQASQPCKLFESTRVRSHWATVQEKWYFSVVDVGQAMADNLNATDYLKKLRNLGSRCAHTLAPDPFHTLTQDLAVQALAGQVGHERMKEMADPAQSLNRARENWQKLGRSTKWIQLRMTGQETRNKRTDDWKESGVERSDEFALLTHIIYQEWTGLSLQAHK